MTIATNDKLRLTRNRAFQNAIVVGVLCNRAQNEIRLD